MTYELHELKRPVMAFDTVLDAVAQSGFKYDSKTRKQAVLHFKESDKPFHMYYGFHSATIYKIGDF
jgi:hypothetical protein